MHHLHLGSATVDPATGFTVRSSELLFVVAQPTRLFFVDVRAHDSFANEELVRVVHDEWPHLMAGHALVGLSGGDAVTAKSRTLLRKKGVQVFLEMPDGTIYGPPGDGFTLSGLSVTVLATADRIWDDVAGLRTAVLANAAAFTDHVPDGTTLTLRLEPLFDDFRIARWILRDDAGNRGFVVGDEESSSALRSDSAPPTPRPRSMEDVASSIDARSKGCCSGWTSTMRGSGTRSSRASCSTSRCVFGARTRSSSTPPVVAAPSRPL